MPDPHLIKQQGQRSVCTACSHVVDILQYIAEGTCRYPQSLLLTSERSDAAVVGSGNKPRHEKVVFVNVSRLRQFEACRTWGSIIIIIRAHDGR